MSTISDSFSTNVNSTTFRRRNRNWLDLPDDITSKILFKLSTVDIIETAQHVCPSWENICKNNLSMWQRIDMRSLGTEHSNKDLDKICREAVDFSKGHLLEISIEKFATNELLNYIAERSSNLKRLRLISCREIKNEGLIEAVAKLPLLEELELTYCPIYKNALEEIGKSCPLLNSFKFNDVFPYYFEPDAEARAIANSMPGLRHLHLVRHRLTSNGLRAILNGCPLLESLDLRKCEHIHFSGELKKTCVDQVRSLKLPDASMDDYPHFFQFPIPEEDDYYDPCPDICGCHGSYSDSESEDGYAIDVDA